MLVEFHTPDAPDDVVATASWDDGEPTVTSEDEEARRSLTTSFRRTPVVIDDASYRRQGTAGAVMIQPGSLEWFRAVIQARVPAETGLTGRFVPGVTEGGYDPAAGYRTFGESIERLTES
jgi:hypothetical protein